MTKIDPFYAVWIFVLVQLTSLWSRIVEEAGLDGDYHVVQQRILIWEVIKIFIWIHLICGEYRQFLWMEMLEREKRNEYNITLFSWFVMTFREFYIRLCNKYDNIKEIQNNL